MEYLQFSDPLVGYHVRVLASDSSDLWALFRDSIYGSAGQTLQPELLVCMKKIRE